MHLRVQKKRFASFSSLLWPGLFICKAHDTVWTGIGMGRMEFRNTSKVIIFRNSTQQVHIELKVEDTGSSEAMRAESFSVWKYWEKEWGAFLNLSVYYANNVISILRSLNLEIIIFDRQSRMPFPALPSIIIIRVRCLPIGSLGKLSLISQHSAYCVVTSYFLHYLLRKPRVLS